MRAFSCLGILVYLLVLKFYLFYPVLLVVALPHAAGQSDSSESDAGLASSDDELPPELDDPADSDASSNDIMPELECGTEDGDYSSSSDEATDSDADDAPPELEAADSHSCSSSSDDGPPPLEAADVEGGMRVGDSSSDADGGEDDAPPGLVDADSDDDSMPGKLGCALNSSNAVQDWCGRGLGSCRRTMCSCCTLYVVVGALDVELV
jgi:hypothetical protein